MTLPLKVSAKGAPLTCEEHDANIDRYLDRANHTGFQSASTIYDLPLFLSNLGVMKDMVGDINKLESQIEDLQHEVLGTGGHVDTLIKALEIAYKEADLSLDNRLKDVEESVIDLKNEDIVLYNLINNLTTKTNELENDITNHDNAINSINNDLVDKGKEIEGLIEQLDGIESLLGGTSMSTILGDLSMINTIIKPIVEGDAWVLERPDNNSTGLILGWDALKEEPIWRYPEMINGGELVDPPGELRLTIKA